jgi:hypothetical protein
MKSAGPRTAVGKLRSKFNATKHGIFSSVILLPGESSAEFDALLDGLREHYQPVGVLEETHVDKLATQLWRYRRFLIAEGAEIRKGIAFPGWNTNHQTNKLVTIVLREDGHEDSKLMESCADPEIREKCLGLLKELKSGIETRGFDLNRDSGILTRLFGKSTEWNAKKTLFARYPTSLPTVTHSGEEPQKTESALPEPCKRNFLEELQEEIRRLERRKSMDSERGTLEALRQYVPDSSLPERLLRYEASLERNIDRTLSQLERLQRMRLGQPVLPKLEVRHSLS